MRRLNLALVFCLYGVAVHLFLLVNACVCCVRFSFSVPNQEIGSGNVSEMTYFVSRRTQLSQSIKPQSCRDVATVFTFYPDNSCLEQLADTSSPSLTYTSFPSFFFSPLSFISLTQLIGWNEGYLSNPAHEDVPLILKDSLPEQVQSGKLRFMRKTAVRVWSLLWSPYGIRQTIIFSSCGFFLSSSFFALPNLSVRRLDVYHTSTHGVALV